MSKYNRMLFVDVELTCWDGNVPAGEVSELIAFGIVDLKTDELKIRREKLFFVQPQVSTISPFCTSLTGITPKEAETAPPLPEVVRTIRKTFGQSDWCAWGRDDALIRESCERAGAELPFLGCFHDLAAQVRGLLGLTYRLGLDEALHRFDLDWEGPPHDALADARNLARLFIALARRLR
ncbi:3'-5' exonuclease [Dongia deserti]|uniref:3'-5' exonuclease n=1 Tax=Dongia deserti TaxID=2268030 RepID=UPI000E64E421|nr:3'-5' exonuclease [Dongia deserti]